MGGFGRSKGSEDDVSIISKSKRNSKKERKQLFLLLIWAGFNRGLLLTFVRLPHKPAVGKKSCTISVVACEFLIHQTEQYGLNHMVASRVSFKKPTNL